MKREPINRHCLVLHHQNVILGFFWPRIQTHQEYSTTEHLFLSNKWQTLLKCNYWVWEMINYDRKVQRNLLTKGKQTEVMTWHLTPGDTPYLKRIEAEKNSFHLFSVNKFKKIKFDGEIFFNFLLSKKNVEKSIIRSGFFRIKMFETITVNPIFTSNNRPTNGYLIESWANWNRIAFFLQENIHEHWIISIKLYCLWSI